MDVRAQLNRKIPVLSSDKPGFNETIAVTVREGQNESGRWTLNTCSILNNEMTFLFGVVVCLLYFFRSILIF